ncbi:MAG: hypothetical protein Q7T57_08685 [Dehalococcoidales bacterium]|nr:hypothetical protein [Dehalococcoidales bacterium]
MKQQPVKSDAERAFNQAINEAWRVYMAELKAPCDKYTAAVTEAKRIFLGVRGDERGKASKGAIGGD